MPRLKLFLLMALAACAPAPKTTVSAFRPADAPLYSAAAFQPARIEGEWRQAAALSAAPTPGCAPGAVRFQGGTVSGSLCLNGRQVAVNGPYNISGPGRLQVPGMGDWWVIWVDSGYRTLAIATPRGDFGFVLDRGSISPDRLVAAGEIFEFNGHSKARLRPF